MYEIVIERTAERDLGQLSAEAFSAIISRIRALAGDPRPPGCRKIVGSKSDWRIRVGDYRVIYEIDDDHRIIRIMRIRHRREAYR